MIKPHLDALWRAFPDHATYQNLEALYTWLGGRAVDNITAPGFGRDGNTCASRMSVAFNKGGAPIDGSLVGPRETIGTADHSRIIFNVAVFRRYLLLTLGKPQLDKASPFDDSFKGKRGVIAFSVNWGNASGHIALYNGTTYREPEHDNYASYVNAIDPKVRTSLGEFWELP